MTSSPYVLDKFVDAGIAQLLKALLAPAFPTRQCQLFRLLAEEGRVVDDLEFHFRYALQA